MADVENQPESSFPVKRKSDLYDNVANKSQKLEPAESKEGEDRVENLNSEQIETEPDKAGDLVVDVEDEDEEVVDRKGKGISREDKGKGKMIEVEESEDEEEEEDSDDDDDEDDDVGFGEEDDESDLSDDPLAEVDLDNILPSRTRRRSTQPGVYISNENRGNVQEEEEEEDSSDDDSDA